MSAQIALRASIPQLRVQGMTMHARRARWDATMETLEQTHRVNARHARPVNPTKMARLAKIALLGSSHLQKLPRMTSLVKNAQLVSGSAQQVPTPQATAKIAQQERPWHGQERPRSASALHVNMESNPLTTAAGALLLVRAHLRLP